MFYNMSLIGNMKTDNTYWSSSVFSNTYGWRQYFVNGYRLRGLRSNDKYVRWGKKKGFCSKGKDKEQLFFCLLIILFLALKCIQFGLSPLAPLLYLFKVFLLLFATVLCASHRKMLFYWLRFCKLRLLNLCTPIRKINFKNINKAGFSDFLHKIIQVCKKF